RRPASPRSWSGPRDGRLPGTHRATDRGPCGEITRHTDGLRPFIGSRYSPHMTLSATLRSFTTLADVDPRSTPDFDGDKATAKWAMKEIGAELAELQEQLYAGGTKGASPSVLLLLQGMDTSGKGGTIECVLGQVNPQGVDITSFKKPTDEE